MLRKALVFSSLLQNRIFINFISRINNNFYYITVINYEDIIRIKKIVIVSRFIAEIRKWKNIF